LGISESYIEYQKFQQDSISALSNFWACLLLAVLSLTGIGWSSLGNWVDAIVKNPDYIDGRKSAERITEIIKGVQNSTYSGCLSEYTCLDDFKTEIDNLYKNIDDNLKLEPEWAKSDLPKIRIALSKLKTEIKKCESLDNDPFCNENFINFLRGRLDICDGIKLSLKDLSTFSNSWADWGLQRVIK
jgi:hypothetical protein